jgi:hypothetical protein
MMDLRSLLLVGWFVDEREALGLDEEREGVGEGGFPGVLVVAVEGTVWCDAVDEVERAVLVDY